MEHNSRMKEITGNLKQDVKHLPTIFPPLWTT